MRAAALALTLVCSGCSAIYMPPETLGSEAPPPELGRPGYVRTLAGAGGWFGALLGGVVGIVLLPITYPVTLLAEEPLGYSEQEFLWMPVTFMASTGHFVLGAPVDGLDFVFRRAWFVEAPEADYEYTPMQQSTGLEKERPAPETEAPAAEAPGEAEK